VPSGVVRLPGWFDEYILDPTTSFDTPNRTLTQDPTPPIIPLLTPHPRPLATYLTQRGLVVRPITYPTVPKGADRVRVCLHAGNTREEVQRLVRGVVEWARSFVENDRAEGKSGKEKLSVGSGEWRRSGRTGGGGGGWEERVLAAKL
jgi:8-amino-7-oxononanoate synthase